MACNVPVVASDVGDVRNVIERTAGCGVFDGTVEDLQAKLVLALRQTRPTTGRLDTASWSSERVLDQILTVYRRLTRLGTASDGRAFASHIEEPAVANLY